jgi:predicted ATPase
LRAAVRLSRLWHDQGRHTEARDLLAPVYGWFIEGFGTPDLKDTKALTRTAVRKRPRNSPSKKILASSNR